MKVRGLEFAAAAGRPGLLTPGNLERARRFQNEYGAPRGAGGTSPQAAWEAREQLTDRERVCFLAEHAEALEDEQAKVLDTEHLNPWTRATLDRAAASRALCKLNYLTIWRK